IAFHTVKDTCSWQQLVQAYDLVLSDSASLHDVCCIAQRPFLYASVSDDEARLMMCRGYEPDLPCLRCIPFSSPLASGGSPFEEIGATFTGAHLATEALKYLLVFPQPLGTKVLRFRFPTFACSEEIVRKSPCCTVCAFSS